MTRRIQIEGPQPLAGEQAARALRRQHEGGDLRHGAGWVELPGRSRASTGTPAKPGDGSGSSRPHASTWTA